MIKSCLYPSSQLEPVGGQADVEPLVGALVESSGYMKEWIYGYDYTN